MPIFTHNYLHNVMSNIYKAEGASEHEASTVATHQVGANLAGHDSHGVIQTMEYVQRIRKGHIMPGATPTIINESPTSARIDGHWGFGFVVTEMAMQMAISKARKHNVSAVTVFRQSHIGRLADYPAMAIKEGMVAIITADSGMGPKAVAPFGGRERRLGTNPICIGVPSNTEGPVILDMATSAVAQGKINLAKNRGESVPESWIVDRYGNPTRNPADYFDGGAILPVGADQGHKGFGLSFMVEVFSGLLTGLGFGIDPQARHNDGCLIVVFNVEAFRSLTEFTSDVGEFIKFIKDTPLAPGFDEIFYPGELEWKTRKKRLTDGIYVEDSTWDAIWGLVIESNLESTIGSP